MQNFFAVLTDGDVVAALIEVAISFVYLMVILVGIWGAIKLKRKR